MSTKLAYARARPIRVAYFVEDNERAAITLDAIFACCFGFWGGRFSLIVPCQQGRPKPAYDDWLEKFDPDIIYSYVDLEGDVVERLHERLYPSFLVHHKLYRDDEVDAHSLRPRLPIDPLKVSTLIPLAAGAAFFEAAQATRVVDTMGRMSNDRFIQDNFGSWTNTAGNSFPGYLREYARVLTIVADDQAQPRERYIRAPDETLDSSISLLNALRTGRISPVARLSGMFTPRMEINNTQLGREFNIVVGDSFADRLFFWNAHAHFPKWRDTGFVDLRIPTSFLENAAALEVIGEFLQSRNQINSNSGGTPLAAIRSSSIPPERLETLSARLKERHAWSTFRVEAVTSADVCIPTQEQLAHSHFTMTDSAFAHTSGLWSETPFQDNEIRISAPVPDHLRYGSTALLSPHEGTWAVDLDIERKIDYSRFDNIQHRWRLPRRLRMTSSFVGNYEIQGPHGRVMIPRVATGGLLTLYANSGSKFPLVRQPDDNSAFVRAFQSGRDWYPFKQQPDQTEPIQVSRGLARSENGRYFWGVLQIFDNLKDATGILLNKFWQEQFQKLGASSAPSQVRRSIIEQTLRNRFRSNVFDLRDQGDFNRLTSVVLQEAENYRTFVPTLSWAELEKSFKQQQDRHWVEHPPPPEAKVDEQEWRQSELSRFTSQVKWLCQIGILHQGFEHRCRKCLHRSWIAIDAVKREIVCEVCGTREAAPVSQTWQFRLNEFVREALRKHGVLPIFWTLSRLRDFKEESFFLEGPVDVYFDDYPWEADGPDSDLDLICVSNGKVYLCEVKQSARQLRKAQNFSTIVSRVRPDFGVIAVMEPASDEISQTFNEFADKLRGSRIDTKLITLRENDFENWF